MIGEPGALDLVPSLVSGSVGVSFSINLGWFCPLLVVGVFVLVVASNSQSRKAEDRRYAAQFERDLRQEIARPTDDQGQGRSAPTLPASVIASIWTHRFFADTNRAITDSERYRATLETVTWNFNRAAPYIVSAALLSLQDAGLIRMTLRPPRRFDSFQRVRIEPTELARTNPALPAVENGLLSASLAFSGKMLGRSTEPSAYSVVRDWIGRTQSRPSRWVVNAAVREGRDLGLYEPVNDQRSRFKKLFGGAPKPVLSMTQIAACEDQAVACVKRWLEFGDKDLQLQQRLLTEVAFGIQARQERS